MLSATGTVVESEKYYPYGSLRSGGITTTDKKFTGQQDEGTPFGLYDYGARFYSRHYGKGVLPNSCLESEPGAFSGTTRIWSALQGRVGQRSRKIAMHPRRWPLVPFLADGPDGEAKQLGEPAPLFPWGAI